jgi:uncharacterized phage infection (PIP) family protein YhgE
MAASPTTQRRIGWVLFVGGIVGVVATLATTIVLWVTLGDVEETTDEALALAEEATASVQQTLQLADDVVGSVRDGLRTVQDALSTVTSTVGSADDVLAKVKDVTAAVPASLDTARGTIRTLASVAATIDDTLTAAAQLPFVPDYRPDRPLAESLKQLDQNLAPIQAALTDHDARVGQLSKDGAGLATGLSGLNTQLAEVNDELDRAAQQIAGYQATGAKASATATSARGDLSRDLTWLRWLSLPAGLGIAIGLLVPVWFGGALLGRLPGLGSLTVRHDPWHPAP